MREAVQFILAAWTAVAAWLTQATLDLMALGRAVAGHAAAVELLALAAMLVFTATFVAARLRLRHRVHAEKRAARSAVSGIARFQAAGARLATATPPVERALDGGHHAARVETRVLDVDPEDEQHVINLMARFKWQLKSSTPVHTSDTKIRERDGRIYSVTETDDYVHLVFERGLDTANLGEIRALEAEYFSIVIPRHPGYWMPVVMMLASILLPPLMIVTWPLGIWWLLNIRKRRRHAEAVTPLMRARQHEILAACDQL
jgi:hypothetical protein